MRIKDYKPGKGYNNKQICSSRCCQLNNTFLAHPEANLRRSFCGNANRGCDLLAEATSNDNNAQKNNNPSDNHDK